MVNRGDLAPSMLLKERDRRLSYSACLYSLLQVAMKLLSVAVEFWSKGVMKAVFLRHEGHAGAIGALLSGLDEAFLL